MHQGQTDGDSDQWNHQWKREAAGRAQLLVGNIAHISHSKFGSLSVITLYHGPHTITAITRRKNNFLQWIGEPHTRELNTLNSTKTAMSATAAADDGRRCLLFLLVRSTYYFWAQQPGDDSFYNRDRLSASIEFD